jgi:phage shock protein E
MTHIQQFILCSAILLSACAPSSPGKDSAAVVQNIDVQVAQSSLKDNGVIVLDVRTPEEYAQGHIPGAKLMDFHGDNFAAELKALDPKAHYVVYCASGNRSNKATQMMQSENFQNVSNVLGGFQAWQSQGLPVE